MTRILFVSPSGTFDNGAEISIYHLMKLLKDNGHVVYNAAPASFPNFEEDYRAHFKEIDVPVTFIPRNKWWWEEAPGLKYGTAGERAAAYRDNISALRQLIKEKEIQVVITNTVNMFQGAVAAACEEVSHFWLIHEFPENEFAYYLDKLDFVAENSDALFAVQGELQKKLQTLLPSKKTIGSFVPFTEVTTKPLKSGEQQRIVSIGRLTPRKNQLELLQAYTRLKEPRPELVLIGAWDDDYKRKVDRFVKEQRLSTVTFTGKKTDPWGEVTERDLCVLPSEMETFGLVYAEALLKGVPVILSDNPGHRSAFDYFGGGELYSSGDVAELTVRIEKSLRDFPLLHQEAASFATVAFEKYQPQRVYQELLEALAVEQLPQKKALRHLAEVLTLNEEKSRLTRTEKRMRQFVNRGSAWLKRRFNND